MEPLWTVRASHAPPRPRKPHHFDEEEEEEEPQARSSEVNPSSGVLLMAVSLSRPRPCLPVLWGTLRVRLIEQQEPCLS
ncbi:unnamed protein product [Microthlaspi erraticum]|uniref:Uncharacterized protein n=1 Tax=Microthlaspi erraticum TaxID=1685480 RepID=A0A6D2HYM4_9BRAS|nr:unnamed protein product [Microthlaspi erraticum]